MTNPLDILLNSFSLEAEAAGARPFPVLGSGSGVLIISGRICNGSLIPCKFHDNFFYLIYFYFSNFLLH